MDLGEHERSLLDRHLGLVIAANERTNITRIDTWEQGQLLHVEDSLVGLPEIMAAPEGPLADLGSGAGFPGIPLAIVTGRDVTLVESVGKKAMLLADFTQELGLSERVTVYAGRAETLAREEGSAFAAITARALSSLPSLMELASPLLRDGGRLVCYKSNGIEEELAVARVIQEKLAMYVVSERETLLSDGETPRRIVVFEKRGEPKVQLPRREGKAQKSPYRK